MSIGPAARPRVVSLVPSATETLLALGADVVGCTRFCEQPGITTVGGTKNPDVDAICSLAPDVVVVDVEENRRPDADALAAAGLTLAVTAVRTIDDALDVVDQLAAAGGVPAVPRPTLRTPLPIGRTAFVPIWRRPWMALGSGTYGASLLRSLGIEVVADGTTEPYPTVELAAVAALGPRLVIVPSEPYEFADDHVAELTAAMPDAAVIRVDGQDLFWWGIRTPAAQRRLAIGVGVGAGTAAASDLNPDRTPR